MPQLDGLRAIAVGAVMVHHLLEILKNMQAWTYIGYMHIIAYDVGMALAFTRLVAAASHGFAGRFGMLLTWRPIAYCGRIAYGLYVFHLTIALSLFSFGKRLGVQWSWGDPLFFVVASLCAFALASISWHLFERPLNHLKRYFPYRYVATRVGR